MGFFSWAFIAIFLAESLDTTLDSPTKPNQRGEERFREAILQKIRVSTSCKLILVK